MNFFNFLLLISKIYGKMAEITALTKQSFRKRGKLWPILIIQKSLKIF